MNTEITKKKKYDPSEFAKKEFDAVIEDLWNYKGNVPNMEKLLIALHAKHRQRHLKYQS